MTIKPLCHFAAACILHNRPVLTWNAVPACSWSAGPRFAATGWNERSMDRFRKDHPAEWEKVNPCPLVCQPE